MDPQETGPRIVAIEEHFMHPALADLFTRERKAPQAIADRLYDYGALRIAEMDAAGIDMQVLSHQSPGSQQLSGDVAVEACRAVNDALAAIVAARPDRFAGLAMLPTDQPEAAADELARAVGELGLKGAMTHGPSNGRFLDDADFWSIFARAEALGVPIYIHPADPDPRVVAAYLAPYDKSHPTLVGPGWGFGMETGVHAVRLMLSGVFDRHPDLQIILGHMGEAIPFLLPRLEESLKRPVNAPSDVAAVFRTNFHVTTSGFFSDVALACCLSVLGAERILFAVDWPYAKNDDAVAWFAGTNLDAESRNMIASGNAARLLGV
ncbi:MAG: amidohydrolase [Rhodobiaceae bacterium]|nr:amidohydrolase [Rhodobiaceae bacterium]